MSQMLYYHVFDGYVRKFWFSESKSFCQKITPTLRKLMPWQAYEKCSTRVYFVECTRHQAFLKTHAYSHYFRIFQATGFQKIGKLNAISNVILSRVEPRSFKLGENNYSSCMPLLLRLLNYLHIDVPRYRELQILI